MHSTNKISVLAIYLLFTGLLKSQDSISSTQLNAFTFRNIGPATTSGRIVDIAVNPKDKSQWFVASAAGGVWKSSNGGTTFEPVFDNYGTQSIGCISIDPVNPSTIWVGTGENNNQRSVSYGNGIYKSLDGGKSFTNMGLKNSEHIGMIAIHPKFGDVVFTAVYGPLWKQGGDRGLYRTTDGGKNWERVLFVSENTGCNEVWFDPNNPETIYAAFHQRRRHEWTYLGGGPESCIYKSVDGGKNWKKLTSGLPSGDIGRIALAISPANSNRIYAMVEAEQGGLYVSDDKGESWAKQNGYYTAGNYYQELFADPLDANKVYIADTWLKMTKDGGKTVESVGEKWKHVDNHSVWIDPEDTRHLLVGCDGGIYETFNSGKDWNFKENLPVTQFYRVSVDNSLPFYYVYGGTQDNYSLGGPSQNASASGIPNSDWFVTVGGDGFKSQIDPTNPDIVYSQWQYGGLIRYDRKTGEQTDIKPISGLNEKGLRWNWDAPLIVSHHNPERLYFAANKVYRSDNRGDSWVAISDDLSRNLDRNKLPVMGRVWSMDAVAKNQSVSIYGNITYLSESPLNKDFLIAGTDDGLIQITRDGGNTWQKQSKFPGIPEMTLVTTVLASEHDKNVIYATFDNHRSGDFAPYILKSSDGGTTWQSIASNLPANGSVKTIAEDFIDKNLLFVGTEFGLFVSNNAGKKWTQWTSGLPPVPIKDIVIQKRECDLVLATFGRGFAIMDNYSPIRALNRENLEKEAHIFKVKKSLIYMPKRPVGNRGNGFKGASYYNAPNPEPGAAIWYHLKDDYKTMKELRQSKEKELQKAGKNTYYPSKDSIRMEVLETAPYLLFIIKSEDGTEVKRIKAAAKKGISKVQWNLRYGSTNPLTYHEPDLENPYAEPDFGPFVPPGKYKVSMMLITENKAVALGNEETMECDFLNKPTIPGIAGDQRIAIVEGFGELRRNISAANEYLRTLKQEFGYIKKSVVVAGLGGNVPEEINKLEKTWNNLNTSLNGDQIMAAKEFETAPGIYSLVETAVSAMIYSTTGPTQSHIEAFKTAESAFNAWVTSAKELDENYQKLQRLLDDAKVPYTPGRRFFLSR